MKNIFLFTLGFLFVCSAGAQQYALQLNLQKGQTYYQQTKGTMQIQQTINGQQMNITTIIAGKAAYTVVGLNEDVYQLELRFLSLEIDLRSGTFILKASSESRDSGNKLSLLYKKLTKEVFTVYMHKNGAVKEITGTDSVFANLLKDVDATEEQKGQLLNQMNQSFGAAALKSNIEMSTHIFPDKKVNVHDTWTKSISLNAIVPGTINASFRLNAATPTEYILSGQAQLVAEDNDNYVNMNGMDTKYLLNGTMLSQIKADAKTGWIKEFKQEQTLGGTIQIKDNPQVPGGLTIPMEIKTTYTTTNK